LQTSKKRSASNSPSTPPDSPLVFFIDECLGTQKVPAAIRAAGHVAKTLADVFSSGMRDEDWLRALEGHEWIILTKDKNIRRHPLEAHALVAAGLRVFVITASDLTGDEMGEVIVTAIPKIRRFCASHPAPFMAGITRMSEVTLLRLRG
jgi:hypothetical protein